MSNRKSVTILRGWLVKPKTRKGPKMNNEKAEEWIWYSTMCSYWTDDFDKLSSISGIPCCPHCRCVGFQVELGIWYEGIKKYDLKDPGYQDFMSGLKNVCRGSGVTVSDLWKDHKKHKLGERIN